MTVNIQMKWTETGATVVSSVPVKCPRCEVDVDPGINHVCGDHKPIKIKLTRQQYFLICCYSLSSFTDGEGRQELLLTKTEAVTVMNILGLSNAAAARNLTNKLIAAIKEARL